MDARVLEMEIGGQVISRGFGFVTFKHEKSVDSAVEAHYINVWGKKVEIKSAIPKCLLPQEHSSDEPQQVQHTIQQQEDTQLQYLQESNSSKSEKSTEGEMMSWADRVSQGQPEQQPTKELKACTTPLPAGGGRDMPVWLTTFKKWLPQFLKEMPKNSREGEFYSLSSLKADFKAIFGLELDHASLGHSKLSDFLKSLPGLCSLKVVHTGGQVPNHMILLPNESRPPPLVIPKKDLPTPCSATPVHEPNDGSLVSQNIGLTKIASEGDTHSNTRSEINVDITDVKKVNGKMSLGMNPNFSVIVPPHNHRFLQFLEPDHVFLGRTWLGTGGFKALDEQFRPKHLVLEALARKRKEVFFLKNIKFYNVR